MDKRITTALIAARDMLVTAAITLPIVVPLWIVLWLRAPAPEPGVGRLQQLLEAGGSILALAMIAGNLGFLAAGWWFRRSRPVEGWERKGPYRLDAFESIALGIQVGVGGLLLQMVSMVVVARSFGIAPPEEDNPLKALTGAGGLALAAVFVLGSIVAPVGEELFFRGHLFRWSASRCGFTYAYVLSATLFVLGHPFPPSWPGRFAVALLYAWSYARWRTLLVPMVAHATNNTIALSIAVLAARLPR